MAQDLTYESAGVDYTPLDAFKRACQQAADRTIGALAAHGMSEPAHTRGQSAYLVETPVDFLAHVEEGLGTKNLVADAMEQLTGRTWYRAIGVDTVATIVNDLVTCGALPVSVAMHAGVGDGKWFDNRARAEALAEGFAEGCAQSGAVWGGGETPALRGIINPEAIVLAGSALGRIAPKHLRITGDIRDGDAMVFLPSSGVHTNGLTLCRELATRLPEGYLTPIGGGRTYGEALLDPSFIYAGFVAACQKADIPIRYAVHLTGHGWRKLMRPDEPFVYRVQTIPPPPPVFDFLVKSGVGLKEAYGTFNMGVGFAVYVRPADASRVLKAARECGFPAIPGGVIEKHGKRKAVVLEPLGIEFAEESLQLR